MEENEVLGAGLEAGADDAAEVDVMDGWDDEADSGEAGGESPLGDEGAESAEDAPEEDGAPEEEDAAPEETKPDEAELVTLTVNHREVRVPRDELVALAQEGIAAKQKLEHVQDSREMRLLRRWAEQAGQPLEQYLDYLEQNLRDTEVQKLVDQGMTPEAAGQYLELQRRDAERASIERQAMQEVQRQNAFVPLVEKYPELRQIPPEVFELIGQGYDPLPAYEHHLLMQENARLKTTQAANKTTEKNRRTLPGSARGMGNTEEDSPFMSGFNSV